MPVEGPPEETEALRAVGDALGNATLVRIIETLGQAVVDMRGMDAADPRLVLEVALVRLSRREAGPPLVLLAERVERLERALAGGAVPGPAPAVPGPAAAPPAPTAAPASAPSSAGPSVPPAAPPVTGPPAGPKAALGALRRRPSADVGTPAGSEPAGGEPVPAAAGDPAAPAAPAAEVPAGDPAAPAVESSGFDLDEVVLAWAELLPTFAMATRSAVQHAQPIRVEGDVVVFGIAPQMLAAAQPRFRSNADTIRTALAARLGRAPRFSLVASDEVDLAGGSGAGAEPTDEPPVAEAPPEDYEPGDLEDARPAGPAVSSVGILEAELGATVVEEHPR